MGLSSASRVSCGTFSSFLVTPSRAAYITGTYFASIFILHNTTRSEEHGYIKDVISSCLQTRSLLRHPYMRKPNTMNKQYIVLFSQISISFGRCQFSNGVLSSWNIWMLRKWWKHSESNTKHLFNIMKIYIKHCLFYPRLFDIVKI